MDQRLVAHLKSYAAAAAAEDKPEPHDINYHKIHQYSEQLAIYAKQATQTSYVGLEEMDRLCQLGEVLQKELYHVRSDLIRRKNLELLLPSPNTQHHLPCSSLLSPSSTPSSPTGQQSMALSTGASTSAGLVSPSTPNGSPTSPHSMNALSVSDTSMAIPSTGVMQSDDYWRSRKIDPSKMVRRSPTPLYVNLTEQMILAQSSKRKRPAEGDLYCHNCKTKDTPEWRRGPMGAKTLCNACGIRWRLSQAEAAKQKKGDQSPTQSIQYPSHITQLPSPSPQPQPPQPSTQQPMSVSQQNLLSQQQQQQQQQQMARQLQQQQQILQQQQQQMQQQLQQQYNQSHHQHQHPQQQHMVLPGHVGLAQENIPQNTRMSISGETAPRSSGSNTVISSLSMTPSPIAT